MFFLMVSFIVFLRLPPPHTVSFMYKQTKNKNISFFLWACKDHSHKHHHHQKTENYESPNADKKSLYLYQGNEKQNLEKLDEASGHVRPSRVTTSKPTLSLATLTSPTKQNILVLGNGEGWWRKRKRMLTSVETLNLEGWIGGFDGLEQFHNKSGFSHTLK